MAQSLKVKGIRGRIAALLKQNTRRAVARADRIALRGLADGTFNEVTGDRGACSDMKGIHTRTPTEWLGIHIASMSYTCHGVAHAWEREMDS